MVAMFVDELGQNEQSLERTFHRCFLPSFTSFGWAVSEEKIKMWKVNGRQTPSDGKNSHCLWQGELKSHQNIYLPFLEIHVHCEGNLKPQLYLTNNCNTKIMINIIKFECIWYCMLNIFNGIINIQYTCTYIVGKYKNLFVRSLETDRKVCLWRVFLTCFAASAN